MANNNARFMAAYNRLDNYLQSLVKTSGHVNMIWYLESISPEQKRSELKTIRQFKNSIKSHGVNPGLKEPIVPEEWIHWLLNELEWCKNNSRVIAPKLQSKLNSSQQNRRNTGPGSTTASPNRNNFNKFPSHRKPTRPQNISFYGFEVERCIKFMRYHGNTRKLGEEISLERAVVHGLLAESKHELDLRAIKYGLQPSSFFETKETLRNRVAKHMVQNLPQYEIDYLMTL